MIFLRERLTYANLMSTIAVFLVLGGATAFAADELLKNSVGSKQLKRGAVTAAKIKNGAITAPKLAPGVAISGPQGPEGPQGPKGATGNANVITYSFGPYDFVTNASFSAVIPGVNSTEFSDGTWQAHLVRASGNLYPIPGPGVNGTSTYRTFISGGNPASLSITRSSGTGEEYADVRLTRIPASEVK